MIGEVVIQVKQNLALFCSIVSLILSWNSVKSFTVRKVFPKMKFEEEYGKLEADKCFQKESWTKYMRQTLVLM